MAQIKSNYIGRFAPSPSGELHFGSLVAALGSYLRARSQNGQWLVRIEDIDPPREIPGAGTAILSTLKNHGLFWDGLVRYQSTRSVNYETLLNKLLGNGQAYYCKCTRKDIAKSGGVYSGKCRDVGLPRDGHALRFYNRQPIHAFTDEHFGPLHIDTTHFTQDFVIKRKDGLYGYNLAVVSDDIDQGVTEIVRGADLLDTTGQQQALYNALGKVPPKYLHLPVAVTEPGKKLSKQNHAAPLDPSKPVENVLLALQFLGLPVTKLKNIQDIHALLSEAIEMFSLKIISKSKEIQVSSQLSQ